MRQHKVKFDYEEGFEPKSNQLEFVFDSSEKESALNLCKGNYQRALVEGTLGWDFGPLIGQYFKYGGNYFNSRKSLLRRLMQNGVGYLYCENRGTGWQLPKLLFGKPPDGLKKVEWRGLVVYGKANE